MPDDYWANTAISTMTGLGIVQGRSTTTFDPKAPITRAQFAAICARFDTGDSSGNQTFSDIRGHWAEKYIERAAELGWIQGFEDGTFRPDTYITRAQAMTMINRVLNRTPEDEEDLLTGMNVWPDCSPGTGSIWQFRRPPTPMTTRIGGRRSLDEADPGSRLDALRALIFDIIFRNTHIGCFF